MGQDEGPKIKETPTELDELMEELDSRLTSIPSIFGNYPNPKHYGESSKKPTLDELDNNYE